MVIFSFCWLIDCSLKVEGGFEISCELLINVAITVITAHKCVMYPMDPIYDAVEVCPSGGLFSSSSWSQ